MKLYLISQFVNSGYDTYDSAVVAAETEEEARNMRPTAYASLREWALPKDVDVQYLGEGEATQACSICASYNAG